jgi:hypothetical protein
MRDTERQAVGVIQLWQWRSLEYERYTNSPDVDADSIPTQRPPSVDTWTLRSAPSVHGSTFSVPMSSDLNDGVSIHTNMITGNRAYVAEHIPPPQLVMFFTRKKKKHVEYAMVRLESEFSFSYQVHFGTTWVCDDHF